MTQGPCCKMRTWVHRPVPMNQLSHKCKALLKAHTHMRKRTCMTCHCQAHAHPNEPDKCESARTTCKEHTQHQTSDGTAHDNAKHFKRMRDNQHKRKTNTRQQSTNAPDNPQTNHVATNRSSVGPPKVTNDVQLAPNGVRSYNCAAKCATNGPHRCPEI